MRAHFQQGSVRREKRKDGDIWTFRWREWKPDGSVIRRKAIVGTVEAYPTKANAWKASEFLRTKINRDVRNTAHHGGTCDPLPADGNVSRW